MNSIPDELLPLLNYCYSLANLLLTEQGEFYPFGVYLDNEQKITQRMFNDGDDFPLSTGLINIFKHDFDQQLASKSIAASAITYEVKVTNSTYPESMDVIVVRMAAQNLAQIILYHMPYQIINSQIEYLSAWIEAE